MRELILVVDDNDSMLQALRFRLERTGYQVLTAPDGLEAWETLQATVPDLIISDVMMPRLNGWDLYARVRATPRLEHIPFIFLTARADTDSIQKGKGLGAEDYIVKPFQTQELVASVQGRLRRAAQLRHRAGEPQVTASLFSIGNMVLDLAAYRLTRGTETIPLTPTEFKLLVFFAERCNKVCTHLDIARALYPDDAKIHDPEESVRVHIKNLRQKIEPNAANPRYIVNVRGIGYRLDP